MGRWVLKLLCIVAIFRVGGRRGNGEVGGGLAASIHVVRRRIRERAGQRHLPDIFTSRSQDLNGLFYCYTVVQITVYAINFSPVS